MNQNNYLQVQISGFSFISALVRKSKRFVSLIRITHRLLPIFILFLSHQKERENTRQF